MAYKNSDDLSGNSETGTQPVTMTAEGNTVDLPDASFVRDADIQRDGMDLVLEGPDGTIVIEGYFAADPAPDLVAPDGSTLTPELVNSFAHSDSQYADAGSMNDASPVGSVQEVSGEATVTRLDGSVEVIISGTPIFQGDVVETSGEGAVNIVFIDETSFAVSEDARLAIDEYVFDPATQSGSTNFSVLKGVFVFTSGLIGRDDPDDVEIDTPVGSIGIRGTIIMGDVDEGEITVVEGAIVLRDLQGNEMTLANQFETGKFMPSEGGIEHMGNMSADHMSHKFASISGVAPDLFSSLNDAASESGDGGEDGIANQNPQNLEEGDESGEGTEAAPESEDAAADETKTHDQAGAEAIDEVVDQSASEEGEGPKMQMPPPGTDPFTGDDTSGFGDGTMTTTDTTMTTTTTDPTPTGSTNGDTTTTANTTTNTSNTNEPPPPPFTVDVAEFGLLENQSTGIVAKLHGNGVAFMNVSLNGPNTADYNLVRVNDNTFDVVYTGAPLDFESVQNLPPIGFSAVDGTGTRVFDGGFAPSVNNLFDEAPTIAPLVETGIPAEYFAASEGSNWVLDLNELFKDIEIPSGDVLSYKLTTSSLTAFNATDVAGYITSASIDAAGNIFSNYLSLNFANTDFGGLAGNTSFELGIQAIDAGGIASTSDFTVTFNVYDQIQTGSGPITLAPTQTYNSNNPESFIFTGSNNSYVLTGAGNDSITVTSSDNNNINTGADDDMITVDNTSNMNNIMGGEGNDTFSIFGVDNKFYGMQDNDVFTLQLTSTSVLADLMAAGPGGNTHLDGGQDGFDTLKFGTSSASVAIDFGTFDDTLIRNFEKLDIANGENNAVTIGYQDIFQMTDKDNVLKINLDAGDTLTIDDEGQSVTVDNSGADPVYYIGDVTLIVDGTTNVAVI